MKEVPLAIFASVRAGFRSRAALQLELLLALRHQLAVYRRRDASPHQALALGVAVQDLDGLAGYPRLRSAEHRIA